MHCSAWFKAPVGAPSGNLYSLTDVQLAPVASVGNVQPVRYLGSGGKLPGEFWTTGDGGSVASILPNLMRCWI